MIEIGSWITQYRKGIWQIVDIKPKFAEEDYIFADGTIQNKGELIGSWILMKKGFTPRMKFKLDYDVCDSFWCKEVGSEVIDAINIYFENNPDDHQLFLNAQYVDHPAVCSMWINLNPEEEEIFREAIRSLPPLFTKEYAMKVFKQYGLEKCFSKPPANYIFVCWHTMWEIDDEYNPLYKNPELKT